MRTCVHAQEANVPYSEMRRFVVAIRHGGSVDLHLQGLLSRCCLPMKYLIYYTFPKPVYSWLLVAQTPCELLIRLKRRLLDRYVQNVADRINDSPISPFRMLQFRNLFVISLRREFDLEREVGESVLFLDHHYRWSFADPFAVLLQKN